MATRAFFLNWLLTIAMSMTLPGLTVVASATGTARAREVAMSESRRRGRTERRKRVNMSVEVRWARGVEYQRIGYGIPMRRSRRFRRLTVKREEPVRTGATPVQAGEGEECRGEQRQRRGIVGHGRSGRSRRRGLGAVGNGYAGQAERHV